MSHQITTQRYCLVSKGRASFIISNTVVNRLLLFGLLIAACTGAQAQDFRNVFVDESDNGKIMSDLLKEVEKEHSVDFIYDEEKLRSLTVLRLREKRKLLEYLDDYLTEYKVIKVQDDVVAIVDKEFGGEYGWKKENYIIFKQSSNTSVSLTGTVLDGRVDEPLIGAQVSVPEFKQGTLTDLDGKFVIKGVTQGVMLMDIQYVGYDPNTYIIGFSPYGKMESITATLLPASKQLESITITAERINENVTSELTGIERLSIATIKATPSFLGEADPIRSLSTLPGVSTAGELASGFNVRGGESGQNLILQDGATIYNPSHLFGFFSAFNPDMVSGVTLYKGGGPANFGSRISSVLDVSLKNGDAGKHAVTGGIGTISSRLSAEGPIVRNKTSYLIGGRISYCNWLVQATDNIQLKNSEANFYDITGKIFHTINENNFLTLSAYKSYDAFSLATDSVFSWGTDNLSLKWDHTFHDNLYFALSVASSNYFSEVQSNNEIDRFTYRNAINSLNLKYDLTYVIGEESKVIAGFESSGTLVEPGKLDPAPDAINVTAENMNDQRSIESAIYVQSDFQLSSKWSVSAGLRYSYFLRMGKDEIYTYDYANLEGRYPEIIDTVSYGSGEVIKSYSGVEPRLSLRFLLSENSSIKASYYRGLQYMHLISNTTSVTPQDYWIASGPYMKPEIGDQISLGYFTNLKDNQYEVSVEGFYKEVENAVDYIEGADITLNPALDAGLSQGKGLAYGVEVLLKRSTGRLNGWIAYTYSRSLRKFDAESRIVINNGEYYPATFDQPNNVSVVMNYQIGPRATFSANFNYSTGRPITIPISKYSYDAYLSVLNYSERNEYRIPDYHRLDFSLTIKDNPKKNPRLKSEWVISVFNVYGRKNAYSIYFDRYGNANKLSVLGSIFPSLTYNFKF